MEAAATVTLEVVHETRYDYAAPVALAHHLAHLQPLDDAHQRLLSHEVVTEPPVESRHAGTDAFGNACLWLSRAQLHDQLLVRSTSRVALRPRFAGLQPAAAPAWDQLAAGLRYVAGGRYDPAVAFVQPSPFVPRLPELLDYARPSMAPGRPVAEAAIDLMHRLHADFSYNSDSTEIDTPLATAFAQRAGVCQDFAHLLAGALRMTGVPARYVSGYLLRTRPRAAPTWWGPMPRMPGCRSTRRGHPACPATGWTWTPPTTACPAAAMCAWRWGAISVT